MISDLRDQLKDQLRATLETGISEEAMKPIKKQVDNICYDLESAILYQAKDSLAENLVAWVDEMATKTIDALLAGNESEMRRYLTCEAGWWNGRDRDHPVIHGKLFEANCIELRRKIAEAHRDLITSERILDLEDQVKSLVKQVNKLEAEKAALWERIR